MAEDRQELQTPDEQKDVKRERQRGSILGARRALATTAVLIAAGSLATIGLNSKPESANSPEKFNSEAFVSKVLQTDLDARYFPGATITINFEGKLPRIRTSPDKPPVAYDNSLGVNEIKYINEAPFNPSADRNSFKITNFTTVLGQNMDNHADLANDQDWLVVEVTKTDGADVLGYVNMSSQTSAYFHVDSGGAPVLLRDIEETDAVNIVSQTTAQ